MQPTADYDYFLPQDRIAQTPRARRDSARMMVLDRGSETIVHARISDLPSFLHPADLVVCNDSRVFPARLSGRWADTGGKAELLMIESLEDRTCWRALCKSGRPLKPGMVFVTEPENIPVEVISEREKFGRVQLRFPDSLDVLSLLERIGRPPVPPYIHREKDDARVELDRRRYQTVYARETGSVAAPTAGLHFTTALLERLACQGTGWARVTLHVGPGTFRPVKSDRVREHRVEAERYLVPEETVRDLNVCREKGGRVLAVGSTTVRTLETMMAEHDAPCSCSGRSELFIYPPFRFRAVDLMLTNFHLPRSSLLMMVCALAGREKVLAAYEEAVRTGYRFYSYGDGMLIV